MKPELLADIPKLMVLLRASGDYTDIRPMQFHGASAMVNAGVVPGGAAKDPLVTMKGHGVYFKSHVILPEPR